MPLRRYHGMTLARWRMPQDNMTCWQRSVDAAIVDRICHQWHISGVWRMSRNVMPMSTMARRHRSCMP